MLRILVLTSGGLAKKGRGEEEAGPTLNARGVKHRRRTKRCVEEDNNTGAGSNSNGNREGYSIGDGSGHSYENITHNRRGEHAHCRFQSMCANGMARMIMGHPGFLRPL